MVEQEYDSKTPELKLCNPRYQSRNDSQHHYGNYFSVHQCMEWNIIELVLYLVKTHETTEKYAF